MQSPRNTIRTRFDRAGVVLSALCLVHCLAGLLLLASMGVSGGFLLSPSFHRFGLVMALIIAAVAIGLGALHHRRTLPLIVAMGGLMFMGGALAVGHGWPEAVLTIVGVSLVATGHILNLRGTH